MESAIPPIGTRGLYSLNAPWATEPSTLYTCVAIRRFVDLENLGVDVFQTYYLPMVNDTITEGQLKASYENDRRNDVPIVSLQSETTAPIYVPNSYIAAFPSLAYRNYHHVVMSASMGPLPDYIDLTFAKTQMANVLSDVIGVEVEVFVNVAAATGVITPDQHEALEVARQAAIDNRTTTYAHNLQLQEQNARLTQRLAILEQYLKDNGIIPE